MKRPPLKLGLRPDNPEEWPEDFRTIMKAIAATLGGRQPTPELLVATASMYSGALPGHVVTITHSPKGIYSKRRAVFHIRVVGERLDGSWGFTPGMLEKLAAAVSRED
jgi:hypothetical protein